MFMGLSGRIMIPEFETELKGLLSQMNNRQLVQFLIMLSARNIIYFSDNFIKNKKTHHLLNVLFIYLGYNFARASDFAFVRLLARDLSSSLDLARTFDRDLSFALARTLDLARDLSFARTFDRDLAVLLDHALERIFVCTFDRDFRETTVSNAQKILRNDNLNIFSESYKQDFKRFVNNLYKINADYWAEWFEKIYINNFKMSKNQIEELFSLTEAQFELTVTETSALLLERRKGVKFFKETRLILLGDKDAGKTSFTRRFKKLNEKMPDEKESTPGVDRHTIKASIINPKYTGEKDFTINIWDFAGHAVTHAAHKFFLSDRAVYVIVFRGRTENRSITINEWLEHIDYYAESSANDKIKVYILVNKSDDNMPQTDYNLKYDEKFDIEKDPRVINLNKENKKGGSLDIFRNDIVDYMATSLQKKEIPATIFDIKKEIETEFKEKSYVSKIKIGEIIQKHIPDSNVDDILRILHSYGICFYYDKLTGENKNVIKADSIVLNPRWVTYAIYRLINFIKNDQEKNPDRKDGHIYEKEYETAFTDKRIPNNIDANYTHEFLIADDRHKFISALAQTFDLAYENEKENFLIFPICLFDNYPDNKNGLGEKEKNDFYVEITTSTELGTSSPVNFPKDIIPAFIVKQHEKLDYIGKKAYCSKVGAVLKYNGIQAEVKKTENTKIVVLVKNNKSASCEFGAELVGDLYKIILKYRIFKNEKTRPSIKIYYTDKSGYKKYCEIIEVLDKNSLIKDIVTTSVWEKLKKSTSEILKELRFKVKINIGPIEGEIEKESDNKKDEEKDNDISSE